MKSRVARRAKVIASVLARLIVLSLLAPPMALGQLRSLDVSQYQHRSWTAQEGYFQGVGISNNAMAQTADGYIWILSPSGLLRFDGVRFMEWKPPKGESFPGAPPSQLLASRDGSLWIAGDGVAQLRADGTWHKYRELDSLRRVRLAEDRDGGIWAGAETPRPNSVSLFRIDRGKVRPFNLPEFFGLGFTPLFGDKEGRLWADSERGIWRILPGPPKLVLRKTLRSSVLNEDSAGALLYAQGGKIWTLSAEGTSEDCLGKVLGHQINSMLRDKDGGLWVGTYGQGIFHLHEGRLDHFSSPDGLSSDLVESIFQDREGNVWSTSPDSIDEFSKPAVPRLTRKQGLSGDSVFSVLNDQRGTIWIGTSDGFDELAGDHVIRPGTQFRNDPGLALVETHAGRLLMTTPRGDQAMAPNYRHLVAATSARARLEGYKNLFSVAEDEDGSLWAVSQELGLLHLHENGDLIEAFKDPKWGDYALSLAFDSKRDGIWFTTHNGKLFFFKNGKTLQTYGRADGLEHGSVRVLHVDDDGGVWLATTAGLAHLMDHRVSILGVKNGLPCGRVHWMRHDQDHHVWLYTECGLVSFSERNLSSWIAEPSRSVTITA
jgi:ligand-binding sensor domain-containing protein